jgi:hypothetical protein
VGLKKKITCLTCGEEFFTNWGNSDLVEHEKIHAKDKRDLGFEEDLGKIT